jgi:NAD(P)-dependent dehydrogenase (short-subunit alcohol dehydrogenase family)
MESKVIFITGVSTGLGRACRFANYLAHSCSDYLAHYRSWRASVIPRSA